MSSEYQDQLSSSSRVRVRVIALSHFHWKNHHSSLRWVEQILLSQNEPVSSQLISADANLQNVVWSHTFGREKSGQVTAGNPLLKTVEDLVGLLAVVGDAI